jgi:hypothetical protein
VGTYFWKILAARRSECAEQVDAYYALVLERRMRYSTLISLVLWAVQLSVWHCRHNHFLSRKGCQLELAKSLSLLAERSSDKSSTRRLSTSAKKRFAKPRVFVMDKETEKMAKSLWKEKQAFRDEYEQQQLGLHNDTESNYYDLDRDVQGGDNQGGMVRRASVFATSMELNGTTLSPVVSNGKMALKGPLVSPPPHSQNEEDFIKNISIIDSEERRTGKRKSGKKRKQKHSVSSLPSRYSLNHVKSRGNSLLPAVRMAPGAIRMGTEDKIYEYNVLY